MKIFERMARHEHEQFVLCNDTASGLKAIIAIHDTTLGPALGGCRMWPYASEDEALEDVARLSRGMTYKAAAAGLNLGGGKSVLIGDPKKDKSEAMFRAFGRFIQGLSGRYITAEDVGTSVPDMVHVRTETRFVTGIPSTLGGSGDPSPFTAMGVYRGMKACAKKVFGSDDLSGRSVAIQGMGNTGWYLATYLKAEGARLLVADIDADRVKRAVTELGAEGVGADAIHSANVDIFSPAALGGIINDATIPTLRARIVAGSANNQLADEEKHGAELKSRGILYAPDFVINAGGLINVANELVGYNKELATQQVNAIGDIIARIIELAEADKVSTHVAANRLAEDRIARIAATRHIRVRGHTADPRG
ncbi:MAG TPA: Glu/Leu/Phe/Val dehydrogenase dimerization domain-containing protein [Candidatus Eisenbacteria bacterium]